MSRTWALTPGHAIDSSALYDAIGSRHSNRGPYHPRAVPADVLTAFSAQASGLDGVAVRWLTAGRLLQRIHLDVTHRGLALQHMNQIRTHRPGNGAGKDGDLRTPPHCSARRFGRSTAGRLQNLLPRSCRTPQSAPPRHRGATLTTANAAHRASRVALIRTHWLAGLLGVLAAAEMLMALSAPAAMMLTGIVGGAALLAAPWLASRSRGVSWALLAIGVVPFTVLTYWAIVPVVLALLALAIGIPLLIHTKRPVERSA